MVFIYFSEAGFAGAGTSVETTFLMPLLPFLVPVPVCYTISCCSCVYKYRSWAQAGDPAAGAGKKVLDLR